MKERPILFSGAMVRAILSGAKTQTRRVVKLTDAGRVREVGSRRNWHLGDPDAVLACHYGQPGDRLWVKETWAPRDHQAMTERDRSNVFYRADDQRRHESDGRWKSPIHMPRWASRLTLEITGVRVERLQAISTWDAQSEGVNPFDYGDICRDDETKHQACFRVLWESINGPGSWDANPWVWRISFKVI